MTLSIPRIAATGYIETADVTKRVPITVEGVQPVNFNIVIDCVAGITESTFKRQFRSNGYVLF